MKTLNNLGNKRTAVKFDSIKDLHKWYNSRNDNELYCDFRLRNTYHVCDVDDHFIYMHIVNKESNKAIKLAFSDFSKAESIWIRQEIKKPVKESKKEAK